VQRTFVRAGIELELSEGMRPKPRLSLPLPLPVGASGVHELAVARVTEAAPEAAAGLAALRAAAPEGIDVLTLAESPRRERPQPVSARYSGELRGDAAAIVSAVGVLEKEKSASVVRRGPKGTKTLRLADSVHDISARPAPGGARLEFEVRYDAGTAARPQEIIEVIADMARVEPVLHRLRRLQVVFAEKARG
jgi:radical SAM-linked protein